MFIIPSIATADVNKRPTPSPAAPLQRVAEDGYSHILQNIMEHFAKIKINPNDTAHPAEYTALRLAVLSGDLASVNVLLNGGADINALHLTYQRLSNPVETKVSQFRTTVLFDAVRQQQEGIVNLLLDRGADVDMGDITPLYRAVSDSNGRMVSLLVKNGADLRIPGASQHFLERGLWYPSYRVFSEECLSKSFLGQALVAVANTLESGSLAETLINSDADVNLLSINEYRLDFSEKNGDERLLQNAFERVSLFGPLLNVPLLAAWRNGNVSLVRLLLDRGAKMWGVEKEIWLQQAINTKPKAKELVEGSYPKEDCSKNLLRVIYGKIIGSDDFREILRKNAYSERRISIFDLIARQIGEQKS